MPPIFPPRSNTFARASIGVVLLLGAVIVGLLVWWVHSSAFNKVGVTIPQPVAFPHGFHISVVQMNCRYCHETVDKSAFAGMPPTETCMSCHSQIRTDSALLAPVRASYENGQAIQWNRVNDMPDYVFFNHQIHIHKGVGCETCHGRVDQKTVDVKVNTYYMAWCLECHENPAKFLRPRENVYQMGYQPAEDQMVIGKRLMQEYEVKDPFQLINCSICHR